MSTGRLVEALSSLALLLLQPAVAHCQTAPLGNPSTARTTVLLVGIEDYSTAVKLAGPARDVCALYQTYRNALRVPEDRITVLLSPSRFPDSSPCKGVRVKAVSRSSLTTTLKEIGTRLATGQRFVIHFSGHGEEVNGEQTILVPDDNSPTTSRVSLNDIAAALHDSAATRADIVLFLDACRDTTSSLTPSLKGSPAAATSLRSFIGFERVAVLSAASSGQLSYIRPHSWQGRPVAPISYFTWAVVKALLGFASANSDSVRVDSLAKHLEEAVPELIRFEFSTNSLAQVPSASFLNEASREIQLPLRARSGNPDSFFFFAEARVVPLDEYGKALSRPHSIDIALPNNPSRFDEYSALNPGNQPFPGPFVIPLPVADLPRAPTTWKYSVRAIFMFALSRTEIIVCNDEPRAPNAELNPEVNTSIDSNSRLIIDATGAFSRWRHALPDLMDREESEPSPPLHVRKPNAGCIT